MRSIFFFVMVNLFAGGAGAAVVDPDRATQYKAPDPDYAYTREVFDCAGRDTLQLAAGYVGAIVDSTHGAPAVFDSYPCRQYTETGAERIYRLEVSGDIVLHARLADEGGPDLDLFLLNDCDTDSCLVGAAVEFLIELTEGTYYLIVDTHDADGLSGVHFTVEIEALWQGVPPAACSGATVVDCDQPEPLPGNLFGKPDLVRTYDCSPGIARGGEDWYEVTSPALRFMSFRVEADSVGLDPVLWLFDGCGPDAVCLGWSDATIASTGEDDGTGIEVLEWPQEEELPATVYVAVDCALSPAAEFIGAYTVTIDCATVPAESRSFGSLRALYR